MPRQILTQLCLSLSLLACQENPLQQAPPPTIKLESLSQGEQAPSTSPIHADTLLGPDTSRVRKLPRPKSKQAYLQVPPNPLPDTLYSDSLYQILLPVQNLGKAPLQILQIQTSCPKILQIQSNSLLYAFGEILELKTEIKPKASKNIKQTCQITFFSNAENAEQTLNWSFQILTRNE